MNQFDSEYINLLKDIIDNGIEKKTRSGKVKSVFGRQIRFDLKKGLPLLTTKKVYTKGVLHELLWFLQKYRNSNGNMNINYLIRNGVHIWDDDAYRWYRETMDKILSSDDITSITYFVAMDDDEISGKPARLQYWLENEIYKNNKEYLMSLTKEDFIDMVLQQVEVHIKLENKTQIYRFGDLGPIYGKQWRAFGVTETDQLANIIKTLKKNPNDRRMVMLAFNPDVLGEVALPPCHVMVQFYTRKLSDSERMKIGDLEDKSTPKYALSCMWVQRSVDVPLGLVWNIVSYSILTHMIANVVNMVPDELVGSLGDCHIYLNQMDGVNEQLERHGSDVYPRLVINGSHKNVESFKYDDFEILDYYPDPPIKMPLSVG